MLLTIKKSEALGKPKNTTTTTIICMHTIIIIRSVYYKQFRNNQPINYNKQLVFASIIILCTIIESTHFAHKKVQLAVVVADLRLIQGNLHERERKTDGIFYIIIVL